MAKKKKQSYQNNYELVPTKTSRVYLIPFLEFGKLWLKNYEYASVT